MIEMVVLITHTYRLMPKIVATQQIPWQFKPLRSVLKFSLSIAFTSSVWVLVTQTDKLLLSKLLPLTDYAYFTLAVLGASGVMVISGPISSALLPRLTKLSAKGDDAGLISLYHNATQLVSVIAIPAALVLAFFAEQVLWAWTGDAEIARKAAPVLMLYALGNGILALGAFPYYLQFAKGDLKLHIIGNALFVLLLIPSLIYATLQYGVIGAGYAWLSANTIYFLVWVPIVHVRFIKGLHIGWLLRDIGAIVLLTVTGAALAHNLVKWPQDRVPVTMLLAVVSLVLLTIAGVGSSWVREIISRKWHALFVR
jgi:O-antigen/teichoic acid export membrane protein